MLGDEDAKSVLRVLSKASKLKSVKLKNQISLLFVIIRESRTLFKN